VSTDRHSVLVVEFDPALRDRIGRWLEYAGFDVLGCPGPSPPDYSCIGARDGRCALAVEANLVVLDLWLASDRVLTGTYAWSLLGYYLAWGRPVVALSPRQDVMRRSLRLIEERVVWLDSPPEERELVETVRAQLRMVEGPSREGTSAPPHCLLHEGK
jgi:DNA-binding response OmpR family regulator